MTMSDGPQEYTINLEWTEGTKRQKKIKIYDDCSQRVRSDVGGRAVTNARSRMQTILAIGRRFCLQSKWNMEDEA